MPKSPQCDRCQRHSGYSGAEYLVCAVHPTGPVETPCPDFAEILEQWEPFGAAYYDSELILQPEQHLSQEDRLEILNTHPLFTGICPKCGTPIPADRQVYLDCDRCCWRDDSV